MLSATHACDVHVDEHGYGSPLVLLHGWAMHGGLFAPLLPALGERHRVHVVDLPGHGASAPPATWSLDAIVDRLEQRFAGSVGPVTLLGWSLGGAIALRWATRHPQRVARLVLVCATPKFIASADWPHAMGADTLARFADELAVAYRATLVRFLSLQVQGGEQAHATLAALRREVFAHAAPRPELLRGALEMLRAIDLRGDVADVGVPALVVSGGRDTLVPPGAATWLAAALPQARQVTFARAAHAPFLSHRDEFLAAVLPFAGDV